MNKIELADLPTMDREIRERAFNYRTGRGGRRSHTNSLTGGGGGGASTPATILGANLIQWVRADQGRTIVTGVSQWDDLSGHAAHFTQASTVSQPAYNATGGPNSQPCITWDTADDYMDSVLALPAPGTTPTFRWAITRFTTWANFGVLYGAYLGGFGAMMNPNSGTNIQQVNAGLANAVDGIATGSWFRHEQLWRNAAGASGDWNKLRATRVNTENAGNTAMPGGNVMTIGKTQSGVACGVSVCEFLHANVVPTTQQLIDLDAYCTARYGAGLV